MWHSKKTSMGIALVSFAIGLSVSQELKHYPARFVSAITREAVAAYANEVVFETDYWKVSLHDDQSYLGRVIFLLKRPARSFTEIDKNELIDFLDILNRYEKAVMGEFGAQLINLSCLMNNGHWYIVPISYVHCHVRPRYPYPVDFMNHRFYDEAFGSHYERRSVRVPTKVRRAIIAKLQDSMTHHHP